MLGSYFELTAYVMLYKLTHELVVLVLHKVVVAYSRTDEHSLYALYLTYLPEKCKVFRMVGFQRRTRSRCKTFLTHTESLAELFFAGGMPEIGCRPSNVMYVTLEIGHFCYSFNLFKY